MTKTTSTVPQSDFSGLSNAIADLWLPAALVLIVWLILRKIDAIALAFKNAPLVRSLKIYGVEIEIDSKALHDLEERENEVFKQLSQKMERASTRAAQSLALSDHLRDAASAIMSKRRSRYGEVTTSLTLRFAIHAPDTIFKYHLYQVTDYFLWQGGGSKPGKGRRFSTRYGIIGLAWRTGESQGTAIAFQGSESDVENLKIRWSMTAAEAESAKDKPSCLAITLNGSKPDSQLGLIYADCSERNFWGNTDEEADTFAKQCEELGAVKNLRAAMADYLAYTNQVRIDLDLTSI